MYREPERACFSKNFCVANASLSWFIVADVAPVKSAIRPGFISVITAFAPELLSYDATAEPLDAYNAKFPVPVPENVKSVPSSIKGADTPSGSVTSAPFCGHGKADVK